MKKYVYHYCALVSGNVYWDGIAQLENEILSFDDYRKLKKTLIAAFNEDMLPEDVSIQSLTLLSQKEI